jgi:hypothetical protein
MSFLISRLAQMASSKRSRTVFLSAAIPVVFGLSAYAEYRQILRSYESKIRRQHQEILTLQEENILLQRENVNTHMSIEILRHLVEGDRVISGNLLRFRKISKSNFILENWDLKNELAFNENSKSLREENEALKEKKAK